MGTYYRERCVVQCRKGGSELHAYTIPEIFSPSIVLNMNLLSKLLTAAEMDELKALLDERERERKTEDAAFRAQASSENARRDASISQLQADIARLDAEIAAIRTAEADRIHGELDAMWEVVRNTLAQRFSAFEVRDLHMRLLQMCSTYSTTPTFHIRWSVSEF